MKENLKNLYLILKSYIRFFFKIKKKYKLPFNKEEYQLFFSDDFGGNKLDANKWRMGQIWGDFHPSQPHQYYGKDEDFVLVKDNYLNLFTRYKPKKFFDFKNSIYITINHGVGLVVSKSSFKYGFYEISGIVPKGEMLWSAIWLTAVKTWPPEIDILEAYSEKNGDYKNKLGIKNFKFQPNIHYGFIENKTKKNYGANSYPIFEAQNREVIYGLHWTENFIKFYYDGCLIFETKKPEILKYFNEKNVEMNIILNNALSPVIENRKYETSCFKIKSVKFFKKK